MLASLLAPALAYALTGARPLVGGRAAATMQVTADLSPPLVAADQRTDLKMRVLQLAAALDRGQSYNPTSSEAYKERMEMNKGYIRELIAATPELPTELSALDGEWELVYTSVPHGIFRSSPFFLAIQEAYARAGAPEKAELFFRLHELQTCSWGVSKIGRVAQRIDSKEGMLYSEFDTNLLSLTVIPILGWFKLLPTFGGCVVTAASAELVTLPAAAGSGDRVIQMEVEYTTSRPVDGLSGLRPLPGDWGKRFAELVWSLKVPVGAVWKLLPWNDGPPVCSAKLVYFDGDFRIVEDKGGDFFVYMRAVAPRP